MQQKLIKVAKELFPEKEFEIIRAEKGKFNHPGLSIEEFQEVVELLIKKMIEVKKLFISLSFR